MDADRNTKPLEELLLYIETLLRYENPDVRLVTNPKILFDKHFELLQKYMAGLEIIKRELEPAVSPVRSSLNVRIGHSDFTYEYLFDIVAHIIHGLYLFDSLRATPKQSFLKDSRTQLQILLFNRLVPPSINDRYKELDWLIGSKGLDTKRFQITLYKELIEAILRFRHNEEEEELSVLFIKLQNLLNKICKSLSSSKFRMSLPSNVIGFMSPQHNYHYPQYLYMIISIGKLQRIEGTVRDNLIKFLCRSVFVLLPDTHEVVANFIIKMLNEYQTITREQTLDYIHDTGGLDDALRFISRNPRTSTSIADEIFELIQHDDSESSAAGSARPSVLSPNPMKSSRDGLEKLPDAKKGGANKSKKVRRIYKKGNSTKKITRRTRRQRNKKR